MKELVWLPEEPGTHTHHDAMKLEDDKKRLPTIGELRMAWEQGVTECFRPITGFGGYYADYNGNIWSTAWNKWKQLSVSNNGHGYLKVGLFISGKIKTMRVQTLVAIAFHGNVPKTTTSRVEVRHLNGNRTDNAPANLAWGTAKQNAADRRKHGNDTWKENLKQYRCVGR